MRITHFERFQKSVLGEMYDEGFKLCKAVDTNPKVPLSDRAFDIVFTPEYLAHYTHSSVEARRNSRKFDITFAQHTYHFLTDRHVFDITPALCKRLQETDFRDIDTFFIKTPSRSMYISLPKGNGIKIPSCDTGELHEVEGLYLLFDDFGKPQTIFLGEKQLEVKDVVKHVNILAVGEEHGEYDDALIFFNLILWQGKVSESIERNVQHIGAQNDLWPHINTIFDLVTKILIYINCSNAVIRNVLGIDLKSAVEAKKSNKKIKKLLHRYSKQSVLPHKQLDVTVIDKSTTSDSTDTNIGHKKLLEKVRPHFKIQHYGTGLSESKVIFIESYVRGELAGSFRQQLQEQKTYKVV
jgi:hypothetical protein